MHAKFLTTAALAVAGLVGFSHATSAGDMPPRNVTATDDKTAFLFPAFGNGAICAPVCRPCLPRPVINPCVPRPVYGGCNPYLSGYGYGGLGGVGYGGAYGGGYGAGYGGVYGGYGVSPAITTPGYGVPGYVVPSFGGGYATPGYTVPALGTPGLDVAPGLNGYGYPLGVGGIYGAAARKTPTRGNDSPYFP